MAVLNDCTKLFVQPYKPCHVAAQPAQWRYPLRLCTRPIIPQIRLYQNWLREQRGLHFDDYDALWRWSTTDLDAFWQSVWDYFDIQSPTPHRACWRERHARRAVVSRRPGELRAPGAAPCRWRARRRHAGHRQPATKKRGAHREISWPELRRQVASLALHLQAQGVQPGDRVAAYLPNVPEAMVAFLATVSIGGVWSICAPDMGTHAVLDRFRQIEPTVLIASMA
jgi:acetoacetyl-CoA synthetase